jgi:hypothetical protein
MSGGLAEPSVVGPKWSLEGSGRSAIGAGSRS